MSERELRTACNAARCCKPRASAGRSPPSAASMPRGPPTPAPFPSHPRWKLVFVNHVTTNPFFVPTQYGIQDACALLGCDYQWTGSANADVGEMVNAMNAAIAAKADAIAVPIVDPHAFDAPIAARAGRRHPGVRLQRRCPGRQRQQAPRLYRPGPVPVRLQMGERIAVDGRLAAWSHCSSPRPASSTSSRGWTAQSPRSRNPARTSTSQQIATGRDGQRGAVEDQSLLSRPPGPERHVRGRCRQHAGRRPR